MPAIIPGTALGTLIANGTWPEVQDPYVDDLLLNTIPDISETGADAWTFDFQTNFSLSSIVDSGSLNGIAEPYATLYLAEQNYRSTVVVDGLQVAPLGAPGTLMQAVGMYTRFYFNLFAPDAAVHSLSITVAPPDHYGNASNTCKGCGQGGNHEIAQDVTSQYFAGWDWVGGCPDRNTGLFDLVVVKASGPVLLRDPIAVTTIITPPATPADYATVNVSFTVAMLCLKPTGNVNGVLNITIPGLAGASITMPVVVRNNNGNWSDITTNTITLQNVRLWWPHTVGFPYLYDASVSFTVNGDSTPSDSVDWRTGFRTVSAEVDPVLGGQVFRVNGQKQFLQGGNWIASDQLNRYNSNYTRYRNEVMMHRDAGLNLIRLWGGSGGHGQTLFDAGDELGVLFMQEFWMSGDNNGRWAGSFSWPLDHSLYLRAVMDTVSMVRGHASVLFYNGGNELFPPGQNPPSDIAAALPVIIQQLDPSGRFYITSSMSTYSPFDPTFALAPQDGPYGILDEREYGIRNPGLEADAQIAFQPELGNTACPEYDTMRRFLSPDILEAFPQQNASYNSVNAVWQYHRYLPFTDSDGWDHLYSYGTPSNSSEYAFRAQLAQVRQYQALYEGFSAAMWMWYGTVIMWKTQGPWPAFRGALYDSYLATSGSYWGVRAGTGMASRPSGNGATFGSIHVQLNQLNRTVVLVNRGFVSSAALNVTVVAFDISTGVRYDLGRNFSAGVIITSLAANSVLTLSQSVAWPTGATTPGQVLLFRFQIFDASTPEQSLIDVNDYWLTNLAPYGAGIPLQPQNYAALDTLRTSGTWVPLSSSTSGQVVPVSRWMPGQGMVNSSDLIVRVNLTAPSNAGAVAFGCRLVLRYGSGLAHLRVLAGTGFVDDRVLPAWQSSNYFSLVPGESRSVHIAVEDWEAGAGANLAVLEVDGWNVPDSVIAVDVV